MKPLLIAIISASLLIPFAGHIAAVVMFISILAVSVLISILKKTNIAKFFADIRAPVSTRSLYIIYTIVVFLFLIFPFILKDYYLDIIIMSGIYSILALGLNVIVGFAGLLNLGFAAFYAIGAYTYAIVNTKLGIGFWTAIPISLFAATIAGLVLSIPALRLRGDYFAIVTLGFGEIVRLILNNWDSLTNGPNGITGIKPPSFFGNSISSLNHYYYIVFLAVVITLFIVRRVELSRIGRAWFAIKGNEIAASSMGINTTRYKIYASAFGAFWAGLAGILFASKMQFVSPESFTFLESILILCMVILGGLGNTYGAIIGAFILMLLPELLRELQLYRMLILGIGLVLLMVFKPQGIIGGLGTRRRY